MGGLCDVQVTIFQRQAAAARAMDLAPLRQLPKLHCLTIAGAWVAGGACCAMGRLDLALQHSNSLQHSNRVS